MVFNKAQCMVFRHGNHFDNSDQMVDVFGRMKMYLPYGVTEEGQMINIDQATRGQF